MSERHQVERLLHEMKFAFEGDESGENRFQPATWFLLKDVDAKRALHRPIADAHNIWELVLHLTTWKQYITVRFQDEQATVTPEMDWPAITDNSEAAWQKAKDDLLRAQNEMVAAAALLNDPQLDSPAKNGPVNRYAIFHGIIQHDQYHGGQIAMLKKASL